MSGEGHTQPPQLCVRCHHSPLSAPAVADKQAMQGADSLLWQVGGAGQGGFGCFGEAEV